MAFDFPNQVNATQAPGLPAILHQPIYVEPYSPAKVR